MVWAAFSATGRVKLAFVPKKMNSFQYRFVLRRSLLPFWRRNRQRNLVFMQDNAPIHRSQSTKDWLARKRIALLDWPANSPDLNPQENVWGYMVRKIYANNKQYQDVNSLKKAIVAAWQTVDQKLIDNLVLSMDNRLFRVIRRQGGPIDY